MSPADAEGVPQVWQAPVSDSFAVLHEILCEGVERHVVARLGSGVRADVGREVVMRGFVEFFGRRGVPMAFLRWVRECIRYRTIAPWQVVLVQARPLTPEEEQFAQQLADRLGKSKTNENEVPV